MQGEKIETVKEAFKLVLNFLREKRSALLDKFLGHC